LALSAGGCVGGQQKPLGFSGVISYDGILYLGSTDGKVMAVDPSARNQEMSFPSSEGEWYFAITMPSKGISCGPSSVPVNIYDTPTVVGESVCIGIYNGKVLMMSPSARSQNLPFPQTRSGEWTYPRTEDVIEPIVGSPVANDDTVYVCSSDGRVYALDMTYGDEKWKSDPLGDKLWITPLVKEETVYVSTFDGHIYALSAKDGSLLPWAFKAEAGFVSSPVLYENVIFVGSFDRNLYAVRVGDNEPLWKFPGGNWFWAAPVVANGVVYAGCLDGKVYAIDSKAGNELWEFDAGSPIVSSPALADDLLVVACDSGKVYALDIFKGEPINEVSIDAPVRASLCMQEGIVYIRAQDNCLYAVDVGKGKTNWRFPLTIK
ncbi:MAG: PQQ-binding-like beta-propeller repeat protein, partial [Dehalococcoidia bacterium]|nr:PQQ-binding-like beta-propeller repeat protein [Dehalococcoidia bacterium]